MALTSPPPYFNYDDASAFMTPQVLVATLDDLNQGPSNNGPGTPITLSPAAMLVFNRLANLACTRVDGFLKRVYAGPFPLTQNPTPANVQMAALLWFKALVFARHAEYVKQYGSGPQKEAMTFCEDLTDSKEWLADLTGGSPPGNAGGIVMNQDPRMVCDGPDGSSNSGDF